MLTRLYKICKQSESSFLIVLFLTLYYKIRGKEIISHELVKINGIRQIHTKSVLKIGVGSVGFVSPRDRTYLKVQGHLLTEKGVDIGRGCRIDIGPNANVTIGAGTSIKPFTKIIITHGLSIGYDCAISWDCQFLDNDFHYIDYEGKRQIENSNIVIGNHVWVGSHVHIFKGTRIPNNCVIASNSVVRGIFLEENCLIAGNPARVIKSNVKWW